MTVKRPENTGAASPSGDDEPPDPRTASRRLLRVDPDSPFAPALSCFLASDQAQLASLAAIANIFLSEVIADLNPTDFIPGEPYCHRSIRESAPVEAASSGSSESILSPAPDTEAFSDSPACQPQLPKFPGYRPTHSVFTWVHDHARSEDMSELAALTGTSITRAYGLVRTAIMLVHGLPRFRERCLQGEFTIGHATIAARACQDLPLPLLAAVDDYLAVRRADTTFETFKKGLHLKVVTLQPISETIERTSVRRRVDFDSDGHGTGFLTLTGPAPELYACYRRIEAFARTIHAGNTSAFGTQLQPDERLDDPRGVAALMYDILSRTCPEVTVTVTRTNTSTGAIRTSDISVGNLVGLNGSPGSAHGTGTASAGTANISTSSAGTPNGDNSSADSSGDDAIPATFGTAAGSGPATDSVFPRQTDLVRGLDHDAEPGEDISYGVRLTMPTHAQWLDTQARVTATVPVLTLLGRTDLPGTLPDGSPIPADMARDLASHSSTWTRILTDPATGTPIDAKASTYAIPRDVRRTLIAQWVTCTIPGCSRKAENTEIDHIDPFDHEDPGNGGLTRFGNLHCLCKAHHQAKTDRRFGVRSAGPLCLEYVFRHGTNVTVHAPDNPINAAQAHLFAALGLPPANGPSVTEPSMTEPSVTEPELEDSEAGISVHEDSKAEDSEQPSVPAFPPIRPQYEFIKIPRQQIVGRFHYRGERRISAERPGPAPAEGRPGWAEGPPNPWSEYPDIRDLNPELKEWYWDSGEPPPF